MAPENRLRLLLEVPLLTGRFGSDRRLGEERTDGLEVWAAGVKARKILILIM